jgi:hypothetical protein
MANGMTPTQRNYAVKRINDITNQMRQAISKKFVTLDVKAITIGELVKLILKGKIKPKKENAHCLFGSSYQQCHTLAEAFEIVDPSDYLRRYPVRNEEKMSAAIAKVEEKATRLKDKLMLSDAAEALKQVEDFANEADALTKQNGR